MDFSMNLQCLALNLFVLQPETRFAINHYAEQSNRAVLAVALPCLQPSASVVLSWFAWEAAKTLNCCFQVRGALH